MDRQNIAEKVVFNCPMPSDSLLKDKPGKCPKCGMDLVKVEPAAETGNSIALETLLKPTNLYVVSGIPVTTIQPGEEGMERSYAGTVFGAPAADVWARIRDFNGLATWHSGLVASSEIEEGKAGDQVGAVRSFSLSLAHNSSLTTCSLRF